MLAYLKVFGRYLLLAALLQCNFEVGRYNRVGALEVTIFDF